MGFFGAVFASLTLFWQWRVGGVGLLLPFVPFAAIGLAAVYVIRLPGEGIVPSKRVGRVIMWSSIGEGFGLFVASNLVINLHRPGLLLPAMALIVGLHFLPIAIAARFRAFYLLGGALTLSAIVGFIVSEPVGGEISGMVAATGLWTAATLALVRDWRAKQVTQLASAPLRR